MYLYSLYYDFFFLIFDFILLKNSTQKLIQRYYKNLVIFGKMIVLQFLENDKQNIINLNNNREIF